jgi:hypothetical protein
MFEVMDGCRCAFFSHSLNLRLRFNCEGNMKFAVLSIVYICSSTEVAMGDVASVAHGSLLVQCMAHLVCSQHIERITGIQIMLLLWQVIPPGQKHNKLQIMGCMSTSHLLFNSRNQHRAHCLTSMSRWTNKQNDHINSGLPLVPYHQMLSKPSDAPRRTPTPLAMPLPAAPLAVLEIPFGYAAQLHPCQH